MINNCSQSLQIPVLCRPAWS